MRPALHPSVSCGLLGALCWLVAANSVGACAQAPSTSPTPDPEIPERRPGLVQDEADALPPQYQEHASKGLLAYGPPEIKVLLVRSAAAPRQYARRIYDEWAWTVFATDQFGRHGNLLIAVFLDAQRVETVADSTFHATLPPDSLDRILTESMEPPLRAGRPTVGVKRGLGTLLDALGANPRETRRVAGGPGPSAEPPHGEGHLRDALVGLLLALGVGLGGIGPFVILAVALVVDRGWLRYLLFAVGWTGAVACGMTAGGVVVGAVGELLGLSSSTVERLAPAGVGVLALVLGGLYGGYRLWRWGRRSDSSPASAPDFQGGEASTSWS